MKKESAGIILMIVLIFLSGCSFTDKTGSAVKSVCNSPYFEYKTNECCLDTNANSICDKDESVSDPVVAEEEPAAVEVKEEVVEEIPAETAVEENKTQEIEITVEDT